MNDKTVQFRSRTRRAGFTPMDNPVLRSKTLSAHAKVVWGLLCFYAREDESCYPGQERLAEFVPCSVRALGTYISELRKVGLVTVVRRGLGQTNVYVLNDLDSLGSADSADQDAQDVPAGSAKSADQGTQNLPIPNTKTQNGTKTQGTKREKPVTYRSRRVPREVVDSATRLLAVFSEATGRPFRARTDAGDVLPALRQVIGALLTRPEVEEEAWERAIRNTVANPPGFVDGALVIGHVFGERAADHALANPGRRGASGPSGASVRSEGVQTGNGGYGEGQRPDWDSALHRE